MKGKTVLVTGSTDGIGQQSALELARTGATVLLHGRNPSRGTAVLEYVRKESRNEKIHLIIADFASLKQVRQMAEEIRTTYSGLGILVNNAGTYELERRLTEDGNEATFAVNHLAPFLLTNLLLDTLMNNAPSRIVNVSSVAHQNARFDASNLQGEKRYEPYEAYALSKLANLMFTYELANRLQGTKITVNALHPGVIDTKLLRAGFGSLRGRSVDDGAARIVHLVSTPELENVSGKYFVNDRAESSSSQSRDARLRQQLWRISRMMVGLSND
ncbi:MAG TPA: SDR family oxidoreductase [Bacteroidota bacterium]